MLVVELEAIQRCFHQLGKQQAYLSNQLPSSKLKRAWSSKILNTDIKTNRNKYIYVIIKIHMRQIPNTSYLYFIGVLGEEAGGVEGL